MSVLIKGMKMPTHCTECDFWHDGVFEHCLLNMEIQNGDVPLDEGEYPNACPLVEIPPHGRLIDADALRLLYDFSGYKPTGDMTEEEFDRLMYRLPVIRAIIDEAPTIIEAEEGE